MSAFPEEDRARPGQIIAEVRREWALQNAHPQGFCTWRGLRRKILFDYPVQGYVDSLPKFKGENVIGIIRAEIAGKEFEAEKGGKPFEKVIIADLGYGNGQFLLDCREEFGDKIELIGYGTDRYTKEPTIVGAISGLSLPATGPMLEQAEVRLVEGNIVDIHKELGNNTVDILVSSYALCYVSYPKWELVKKCYRVVKLGGIALLNGCEISFTEDKEAKRVENYLACEGYEFEFTNMGTSFRKNKPDITLPLRTPFFVLGSEFSPLYVPQLEEIP